MTCKLLARSGRFLDNAKREELIRRGRQRAGRFTGKDFAKGLLGLLDEFNQ